MLVKMELMSFGQCASSRRHSVGRARIWITSVQEWPTVWSPHKVREEQQRLFLQWTHSSKKPKVWLQSQSSQAELCERCRWGLKHTIPRDQLQFCFLWVNLSLTLSMKAELNYAIWHTQRHTQTALQPRLIVASLAGMLHSRTSPEAWQAWKLINFP